MSVVLSEHLPLLASAPDGIQKLRGLILELAVRGKLVPQDSNDEPASELVKRIAQDRARLKAGITREKIGKAPLSGGNEWPFELPQGWEWERFGELAEIERGGSPRPIKSFLTDDPSGLNWIKIGDTDKGGKYITSTSEKIRREGLTKTRMVYPGDFLLTNSMSFGRPYITQIEGCIHDGWLRISPPKSLDKDYLYTLLSSPFVRKLFVIAAAGAVVMNLNAEKVRELAIPLPPLAEQHRIVAKVDELMALCDRLEAEQADSASAHARLVETLLGTLCQTTDAADLAANWQRLAEHFDRLFNTEASIEAIKQTVLQLAVMGRLVPQEPGTEPASELLKLIAQERRRLAPPTGKKSNPQPPTTYKEGPFGIPNSWVWTDVESISNVGTGTTPSRTNPAYFTPAQIHWVTSGETRDAFIGTTAEKVSPLALEETNLTIYPVGTLIVAMYGQGKTRGQISELQIDATTNQACAAIVPILPNVATRKYIKLFFRKIYDEIREEAAGGAQPNLNVGKIKATLIPLPPLTEQERIVAKVDELMALCDRLKSDLAIACQRQTTLANTLIESALEAA